MEQPGGAHSAPGQRLFVDGQQAGVQARSEFGALCAEAALSKSSVSRVLDCNIVSRGPLTAPILSILPPCAASKPKPR